MYQSNPISLSSILLSQFTAISECTACTEFVVHFAVVIVKVFVTLDYLICQETTIRGQ
jgi:hypothetical protein